MKIKNICKKIFYVFLIILGIFLLFWLIIFINNKIRVKRDKAFLKEAGYYNLVSAGNYSVNVLPYGNENGKHRIIVMAGYGIPDSCITMRRMTSTLEVENQVIFIDRAGYGISEDTNQDMTVENIVEAYRTALKNAGIEAPYILMPHSIGGVYATYWESMYPDEIEGVIFVDGTPLGMNIYEEEDYSISFSDYFDIFLCRLGIQRFNIGDVSDPLPSEYTKDEQKLTDYLNIKSSMNKAPLSEIKEKNNNGNKAYQSIKSNDIPKIYIESSHGARTIEEVKEDLKWVVKRKQELGLETISTMPTDDKITQLIEQNIEMEKEQIIPYIEILGNTEIILLSGDHYIFEQKPNELTRIIKDYINDIDK